MLKYVTIKYVCFHLYFQRNINSQINETTYLFPSFKYGAFGFHMIPQLCLTLNKNTFCNSVDCGYNRTYQGSVSLCHTGCDKVCSWKPMHWGQPRNQLPACSLSRLGPTMWMWFLSAGSSEQLKLLFTLSYWCLRVGACEAWSPNDVPNPVCMWSFAITSTSSYTSMVRQVRHEP